MPYSPARWVLDTNVVLDCLYFDDPIARPLWRALAAGQAICYADAATLDELRRVLAYRQFALTPGRQIELHARYAGLATRLALADATALPRCRDAADQKFLTLAANAGAELLVSKDRDLLKLRPGKQLGFHIVAPAEVPMPWR